VRPVVTEAFRFGAALFESELFNRPGVFVMSPSEKANREFWVGRRAEQPKAVVKLSAAEFVSEANRRLHASKSYRPGTRFIVPGAIERVASPTWEGPPDMRPLIQRIVQDMTSKFDMDVPFRIDNSG
jgi:hypothetical protein